MAAPGKVFSLEGRVLKIDTAQDLEAHIGPLQAMEDVEEVRILGNTLGVEACKLLGEVLATKKSLKVSSDGQKVSESMESFANASVPNNLDRKLGRHLHRPTTKRNPRSSFVSAHVYSQPT